MLHLVYSDVHNARRVSAECFMYWNSCFKRRITSPRGGCLYTSLSEYRCATISYVIGEASHVISGGLFTWQIGHQSAADPTDTSDNIARYNGRRSELASLVVHRLAFSRFLWRWHWRQTVAPWPATRVARCWTWNQAVAGSTLTHCAAEYNLTACATWYSVRPIAWLCGWEGNRRTGVAPTLWFTPPACWEAHERERERWAVSSHAYCLSYGLWHLHLTYYLQKACPYRLCITCYFVVPSWRSKDHRSLTLLRINTYVTQGLKFP